MTPLAAPAVASRGSAALLAHHHVHGGLAFGVFGPLPAPPLHHLPPPPRVIHEGADPVDVVTQNMSRPLKPEVDSRVAQAAHLAEVPTVPSDGATALPGCTINC